MRIPLPRRHWSPDYVYSRVKVAAYQRRHPAAPWLTEAMIQFLEGWLKPSDVVVEFGSGRSTLWFAERTARVISVEHEAGWHAEITARLKDQRVGNVTYVLAQDPDLYARAGDTPVDAADLILVDGFNRDATALWALQKIKPGGMILVDNASWYLPHATRAPSSVGEHGEPPTERWREFWQVVRHWRHSWTSNGVWDTAAFFAPHER
jgi:predicted O-methyltransferase YrrM